MIQTIESVAANCLDADLVEALQHELFEAQIFEAQIELRVARERLKGRLADKAAAAKAATGIERAVARKRQRCGPQAAAQ